MQSRRILTLTLSLSRREALQTAYLRLSGLRHKYDDVRCAQFGLWRGARRGHPRPWGCNRRATKPQAKFGATRRAAGLFRPDFVARSSQIHCGICSSLSPRLDEKSLAANVIVFMPQTTNLTTPDTVEGPARA